MVIYITFLHDVACQKLKSANVSRSYSKNNTGTVFFETRCITKIMFVRAVIQAGNSDSCVMSVAKENLRVTIGWYF